MSEMKRPPEVLELIRTLNPDVPYKEFEAARGVEELHAVIAYVYELERAARNRDMWKGQAERQAKELEVLRASLSARLSV